MKAILTSSLGGSTKINGKRVTTQNLFLKKLKLKERLLEYKGILVAWSAGSMNCAEKVYASPEFIF